MADLQEKFGVSFQEAKNPEREEIEIVTEEEAAVEKAPEEKPLTKEEIEELRKRADAQVQTKETFNLLSEQFKASQKTQVNPQPANIPQQRPTETDEEYGKRVEEEMFKPGRALGILRETIGKEVAPVIQNLQNITVQQGRRLLELDPEKGTYFKKYKGEIDEFVRGLPPVQQMTPGVYDFAYDRVMSTKQNEIVEEKVNATIEQRVNEALKKKLKELGIEEEGQETEDKATKKSTYTESSKGMGVVRTSATTRKIVATVEDRRRAEEKGLSLRDYLIGIGKI